ncbi:MAG: hypothetical protein J5823_01445 [Paludibacteraceae bacterium]|nr:hypothetical protein [Paludibacteraceae bacterium]
MSNIRKFIVGLIGLLCVSVGYADDITLITEDASSDTLLYGCGKYPRSGVYADVPYGDETRTLNLKIYQYRSSEDQVATITLGDTLIFGCSQIAPETPGAAVYYDTIPDDGFDRILKLSLTTNAPAPVECDTAFKSIEASIIDGDTLIFGCKLLWEEGVYKDTLRKADNSCDSIVTLTLAFLPPEPVECDTAFKSIEASIIDGDTLVFGCYWLTEEGEYKDTLRKIDNSCDSIVTLTLTVLPASCDTAWYAYEDSIYEGGEYLFGDETLTLPGVYVDTLSKADLSCDSIVTLTLKVLVREYAYDTIFDSVCVGSTYQIRDLILALENDTALNDTVVDAIAMYPDENEPLRHIYTDSVVTYYLTVWQPTDSTKQDSIELGQSYFFFDEELVPTEAGLIVRDTILTNSHGCDSVFTLELNVIAVEELHEYVYGTVQDTVCVGSTYEAGSLQLVITQDTIVTDTVFAVQQVKDDILHTLTYTDSVTTYTVLTWHNELATEIEWGNAFCGTPYNGADEALGALREAIEADDLFEKDTILSLLWKDANGEYVPYTGAEMSPEAEEIDLRAEVSNACTTVQFDHTLSIQKPDYELSDEFADMPAVSKYNDWLLMIDLDSLNKVYGMYPEPDSVRWFHITGTDPDIDADELVGTGYYYTDDRHLVGSYYAIITLPEETDACGGSWRTRIVVRTSDSAPMLAPNAVRQGEPMWLYHLHASGEVHIFSANGVCARVLHYDAEASDLNGIMRITTDALPAGVYMLHINNGVDRAAMPFIIRE